MLHLSNRVYKSGSVEPLRSTNPASRRPATYKRWNEDVMAHAVSAVVKSNLSVRQAAVEFNLPRSTLNDRISGRVLQGAVSGRPKYLSTKEEEELVEFLYKCSSIGYPKSRTDVIAIAQRICSHKGVDVVVTHGWWESFCKRHPDVTLRITAPLSRSRAIAADLEVLERYFDMLEDTLRENKLLHKPAQIFNVDESGMPFDAIATKGICKVGTKNPVSIAGDKGQVTVVGCANAAGHCIPPMVIWDRKTLQPSMANGEVPGTIYGLSGSGWMDKELFSVWFEQHFLRYASAARPLLLLMDGHSSHYCPEVIRSAAKDQVILFVLPPNTTHLVQPLDRGCFGPLKAEWKNVVHEYMAKNPGKVVTRYSFSELFCEAWVRSMTMRNVMSAFRVTGIFPLDRTKLLSLPGIVPLPSLVEESGLAYIPMFSPMIARSSRKESRSEVSSEEEEYIGSSEHLDSFAEDGSPITSKQDVDQSILCTPQHYTTRKLVNVNEDRLCLLHQPGRSLAKLLDCPTPLSKLPTIKPKQSSRVLTSCENLEMLEQRQNKKEEEAKKKEERMKLRKEKKSKPDKPCAKKTANATAKTQAAEKGSSHCQADVQKQAKGMSSCTRSQMQCKKGIEGNDITLNHATCGPMPSDIVNVSDSDPDPDETWWIKSLKLYTADERALLDEEEVTDNIINAAHSLLGRQFPTVSGLQDPARGHDMSYDAVPFGNSVQILHTGDHHWVCTARLGCETVLVMDSLSSCVPMTSHTLLQVAKIYTLPDTQSVLNVKEISVQQQRGDLDCGLFAIAYAIEVCMGNSPDCLAFNQNMMRQHLHKCFTSGTLDCFPRILPRRAIVLKSTPVTHSIKLYCCCKMPDFFEKHMICCDHCEEWFHYSCVGIDCRSSKCKTWKCPSCVKK